MREALVFVVLANARWTRTLRPLVGFPLTGTALAILWHNGWLPAATYSYETTAPEFLYDIAALTLALDASQTLVHWLSHTHLRNTPLGRAHAVHHRHTSPTPRDAFDTGALDAIAQLILPLVACIHAIRPSRGALILFGTLYSNWLHYIHSTPTKNPWMESFGLVTPEHHHDHHKRPWRNFSTVFDIF